MSGFRKWLNEVGPQLSGRASAGEVPPLGPADLEGLRRSLRARMAKNEIYFRIAFALAVLLALATLIAAFLPGGKGTAWVPAAFGISTAGAIMMAMNAVREKHSFDMMLELAVGLDDDAVREVLQVLLKKYAGPTSRYTPGSPLAPRRASRRGGLDVPQS
jgi:hypothetical protein